MRTIRIDLLMLTEPIPPHKAGLTIAPNTWGDKKFKLKNRYRQLSDADLYYAEGGEAELSQRLQVGLGMTEAQVLQLIASL